MVDYPYLGLISQHVYNDIHNRRGTSSQFTNYQAGMLVSHTQKLMPTLHTGVHCGFS